jgi:hypothetical protein
MKNELTTGMIPIATTSLTVHPALDGFPSLSPEQLLVLQGSIERCGITDPLIMTPDREVYSGRSRLHCAKILELANVPVIMRPEKDVIGYAIENRIARGQLTKSGIVMVLFEQHPDLAKAPKMGRPNKCSSGEHLSKQHDSFRSLGARYQVPYQYFSLLGEMRQDATEEEWQELRKVILEEEASIPRQYAGFKTGLKPGTKRGAVIYASVDEQGYLEGILPRAFSSIREGFSRWETEIDSKSKAAVEKQWGELLDVAPPQLLRMAKRKAVES